MYRDLLAIVVKVAARHGVSDTGVGKGRLEA